MMYPGMMPQVPMMPQPMAPQPMMQPFPPGMAQQPMNPQGIPQSLPSPVAAVPVSPQAIAPQPVVAAPKENPVKNVQLPLERRSAKSSAPEVVEDLDFMTELPDIS
jgi:hypothetical protein